ncbi:hypothetical protein FHG87_010099 [Trinorchestia longiramus]|nr:hypothetical protein FHG87_010099 [Trinorchestia longiramus]
MSFIYFLGKPILPPVEKKEDEWLLSLSQAAAVDVLLNDPTYPGQAKKKSKPNKAASKQRYDIPSISSSIGSADLNYSNATWCLGKLSTPLPSSSSVVNLEKKSQCGIHEHSRSGLMLSPHQSPVSQHYADASPYQVQYSQQYHLQKHQVQEEQPKHLLQQKQKEQLRLQQLQEQRLRARGYSNSFQLAMSRSCAEDDLPAVRRRSLPRSSLLNSSTTTLMLSSSDSVQPTMDLCKAKIPVVPPPVPPPLVPSQHVLDDYLLQLTGQALPPPPSKTQSMSQSWSPCVQTQSDVIDSRQQASLFSSSQSTDSEETKHDSNRSATEGSGSSLPGVSDSQISEKKASTCVTEEEQGLESLLDSPSSEELPKWLLEAKTRRQKGDVNGRSVGSNYLDSYLGNLTHHSWLNYAPSTPVQPAAYSPKRVFIYPEVFYKKDPTPGEPLFMSRSFTEGVTSAESLKYRDGLKRSRIGKTSSPSAVMEVCDAMSGEERNSNDSPVDTAGRLSAIGTIDDVSITPSVGTESGMGTDIGTKALSSLSRTSSSRFSDIANVITEAEHSFAVDSLETDVPCGTETSGVITHGTQSNGSEAPPNAVDEEEVTISESFPDIPFENENHEDSSAIKALGDDSRSLSSSDTEKVYAKNQTDNSRSQSGSDTEKENSKPGLNFLVGGLVSARDDQSYTSNASDESSCCTQPSTIVMIRDEANNNLNSAQTGNKASIPSNDILSKSPSSLTCQQTDRNVSEKSSSLQDNLVNNNNILNNMNNRKSETSSQSKELIQDSLNSSFDSLSSLKKLSLNSNSTTTVAKNERDTNIGELDVENESEETVVSQGKIVSFDLPHCTSAASTPDMSLVSAASVCGTSASLAEDSEMTASDICRDDTEEAFEDHEQEGETSSDGKQVDLSGTPDACYPDRPNEDLEHDDLCRERKPVGSDNFQQESIGVKSGDTPKVNFSEEEGNSTNGTSWTTLDQYNMPSKSEHGNVEASTFGVMNVQENRNIDTNMVTNREKVSVASVNQDFISSPSHTTFNSRSVTTVHQRPVAVTAPLPVVSSAVEKRPSSNGISSPVTSCRSLSTVPTPGNELVQATSPARTQYCPIVSGNHTNTSTGTPPTGNGSKPNTPSSPARASFCATTPTAAGTCFYQQQSSRVTTPMSSPHRHSTPTTPSGSFYSPVAPGGSGVLGKCSSRQHQINALLQLLRVQHHHEREQLIAKQQEEMQQFMQHLQKLTPAQLQHIVSSQVSSVQSARGAGRTSEVEMNKSPSTGESAPTASQGSPPNNDSSSPCEDSYASSSVTASQSTPSLTDGSKNAANKSPTAFYLHNPANPVAATTPGHLNKLFLQFPSKKMPSPPQKAMSPLCSKPMATRSHTPHVSRAMSEGTENSVDVPTTVIVSDHDPNSLMSTSQSKHAKQVINEKQAAHCKKSSPAVIKEKMLSAPSTSTVTAQLAPITPHEDMAELSASLTNSDIFNSLQSSLISDGGGNPKSLPRSATVTKLTTETFLPAQRSENKDAATPRPVLQNKSRRRSNNSTVVQGLTKLQAAVRGRHVRQLLRCSAVQQHILTLAEVNKLAAQFHRDILADNVNKGDIDFHRALYQQEQVARSELRRIFMSCSFVEQVRLIRRDRRRSDSKVPRLPRPRASLASKGSVTQHRPASAGRSACTGGTQPQARSRSQPSPRQLPLPKKYHQVHSDHSMEQTSSMTHSYPHGSNGGHSYGVGTAGHDGGGVNHSRAASGGVGHGGAGSGGIGHGGVGSTNHDEGSKSLHKSGRTAGSSQYRHVQSRYLGRVSRNSSQNNTTSRNNRPSSGVPRRVALPNCAASASFSSGAIAPGSKTPHHNEKICQQRAHAAGATGGGTGYGRMNGSMSGAGGNRRLMVGNGSSATSTGGGTPYDRRGNRKLWR